MGEIEYYRRHFQGWRIGYQRKGYINVGGGLGLRFLLARNGLNDTFYLEPRLTVDYASKEYSSKKLDTYYKLGDLTMTPSARLGWDWYYDSGFYMSLGLGLGYTFPLKRDLKISANIKKLMDDSFIGGLFFQTDPGKGRFYVDLEYKLGFAF